MSRSRPAPSRRLATGNRPTVTRGIPALGIACDILGLQLTIIRYNTRLAMRTRGVAAIHDLRVAIRRFRTALRIFKPFLVGTPAARIDRQLRTVNRRLGPIRDAQVWSEFLTEEDRAGDPSPPPEWERCLRLAAKSRLARERAIAGILASPRHRSLLRQAARLVRTDIPRVHRRGNDTDGRPFLAGALVKTLDRLPRSYEAALSEHVEAAHRFRRRCRRARYLAEFSNPALGEMAGKLTRRLKDVADALGDRHDAEVQLERRAVCGGAPDELVQIVKRRRREARRRFDKAWKRLFAPRFMKTIREALKSRNGGSA